MGQEPVKLDKDSCTQVVGRIKNEKGSQKLWVTGSCPARRLLRRHEER